jgi:MFS family permease
MPKFGVGLGKPVVLTAALATSVGQLGANVYMPALPAIASGFHVSASVMAQTMAVYLAGFAVAILSAGPYVDAHGRRGAMLRGLAVYAIGTAVCAGAAQVSWLFLGRFLQALGAGMPTAAGRAIVAIHLPERRPHMPWAV